MGINEYIYIHNYIYIIYIIMGKYGKVSTADNLSSTFQLLGARKAFFTKISWFFPKGYAEN